MTATLATERAFVLYRFFDGDGRLLYIGLSGGFGKRLTSHRGTKDWWPEVVRIELERYPDMASVLAAERTAIMNEQPLYNVQHIAERPARRVVDGRVYSARHARRLRRGK